MRNSTLFLQCVVDETRADANRCRCCCRPGPDYGWGRCLTSGISGAVPCGRRVGGHDLERGGAGRNPPRLPRSDRPLPQPLSPLGSDVGHVGCIRTNSIRRLRQRTSDRRRHRSGAPRSNQLRRSPTSHRALPEFDRSGTEPCSVRRHTRIVVLRSGRRGRAGRPCVIWGSSGRCHSQRSSQRWFSRGIWLCRPELRVGEPSAGRRRVRHRDGGPESMATPFAFRAGHAERPTARRSNPRVHRAELGFRHPVRDRARPATRPAVRPRATPATGL